MSSHTKKPLLLPREHQIIMAIRNGQTLKNICREMKITERTLQFYLTSLFRACF